MGSGRRVNDGRDGGEGPATMTVQNTEAECRVIELDEEQGAELFDRTAQACMGMSGADFLRAWDAGKFDGVNWDDVPGLAEVAIALPFAGR